ncbi:SDR family oxidoreductase [Oceanobacter kriegii]|uniref:SDR family oxidoreductase n=1 Tax=Oceanobacter kriegii TaxID=64972 RepID=UPI00042995EB|nr:SDR family oxidoreductase [Oceanobacter kriegii]
MTASLTGSLAANLPLQHQYALITGAASGIGLASTRAMVAAGATVVMADRDAAALAAAQQSLGDAVIPLEVDLLDVEQCRQLIPQALQRVPHINIFHANAGMYLGGDLIDNSSDAIDRMLNLNVNVVMKNVHDLLPHMIERQTGDIIVTSSAAATKAVEWEPVYSPSKWAVDCFVQATRRQVLQHGLRMGTISPGPVETALLADWPEEKLQQAKEKGTLIAAEEIAETILFMLTRPRGMTIRDMVIVPSGFDF